MEQEFGQSLFHISSEAYFKLPTGFIVPKGAIWARQANRICQRLVQSGIVEKIRDSYTAKTRTVETPPPKAFGLEHMFIGFIVMIIGNLLSLLVLIIEVGCKRLRPKPRQ